MLKERFTFRGQDQDRASVGQTVRVRDGERDPVAGVAAEVVTAGRDRERAALDAADRSPGVSVALVQEVDPPGEGAGRQRPVVRVGAVPRIGDHVTRDEEAAVLRRQDRRRRRAADADRDGCRKGRVHAVRDREPRRVLTGLVYVWLGFAAVDVPPSPNVQAYVSVWPSGSDEPALEKLTASGGGPAVGFADPTAIGA